jgi:hypothetical protein
MMSRKFILGSRTQDIAADSLSLCRNQSNMQHVTKCFLYRVFLPSIWLVAVYETGMYRVLKLQLSIQLNFLT